MDDADSADGDLQGPKAKKAIKSAKIDELVKYLQAFPADEKTLVFSQFTSFLDHVATRLDGLGMRFVRFHGSMPAKKVCFSARDRWDPSLTAVDHTEWGIFGRAADADRGSR